MPWPRNKGLPGFPCQFDPFAVCLARCIPSFCQHPRNTSCNQPALSDCPRCPFIRHSLPLLFHRTHANSRRYHSPLPKNKEFRYLVQRPVRIPYAQACQRPASLAPVPPPSLHALSAPPGPGGRGDCDGHSFAGFLFPTLWHLTLGALCLCPLTRSRPTEDSGHQRHQHSTPAIKHLPSAPPPTAHLQWHTTELPGPSLDA